MIKTKVTEITKKYDKEGNLILLRRRLELKLLKIIPHTVLILMRLRRIGS